MIYRSQILNKMIILSKSQKEIRVKTKKLLMLVKQELVYKKII